MECHMPGFSVLHYLLEFAQIPVHWVSDAIQPSHLLSPPAPPGFNLSQHPGLFQLVCSLHQVAKVLGLQLPHQSFQWIFGLISFRMDWLDLLAVQETLKSFLQRHSSEASMFGAQSRWCPTLTSVHGHLALAICMNMAGLACFALLSFFPRRLENQDLWVYVRANVFECQGFRFLVSIFK